MALPVGDESTARPGAAQDGTEREPDPSPGEQANRAEDQARRAVEGVGIEGVASHVSHKLDHRR